MAWLGAAASALGGMMGGAGTAGAASGLSGLGGSIAPMMMGTGGADPFLGQIGPQAAKGAAGAKGAGMGAIMPSAPKAKPTGGMGGAGQPGFADFMSQSGKSPTPDPHISVKKPAKSNAFTKYVQNQLDVKGRMNDGTFNHQRVHARPLPPQAPVGQALIRQGARSGAVPVGSSIVAEILRQRMGVN